MADTKADPKSPQRLTAESLISAFIRMDIPTILSHRSPDCLRYILLSTLGHPPTNNETYARHLNQLKPIIKNFSLTVNDVLEDREARRICMWLSARADTVVGDYINEYMWTLTFDETGTIITRMNEFVDTVMNRDFWPKLSAAMKARQTSQQKDG